MPAAELHVTPSRATSSNGLNLDGAKWFFYQTGTTTPQSVYTTAALNIAHSNPVEADAAGKFPPIYFDSSLEYRGVLKTSDEATTIYDIDPINASVLATLGASDGSSAIGFIQSGANAVARTAQDKMRDVVSVKDFGAVGDGSADDTTAITNALAALSSGGSLYFPAGTYKFLRGNGALLADNIGASNVTIYGDGAASKIVGYNAAGATPNDVGNQYYNVFQATSRSNIKIRDLAFEGYTTPISLFSCTNVVVDNIFDNAQLSNAGAYMRDKGVYLETCTDVKITNSRFINFQFAVYVSGSAPSKSSRVVVNSCSFEHTTAAGSYNSPFPVGVYWYFSDNCIVSGCTFKNIYSSVDNGTTGTGMGYGVYEGDGTSTSGVITGNTFHLTSKGSKNHTGIYIAEMEECAITGNTFFVESGGRMLSGILLDSKNQNSKITVSGNTFDNKSTAISCAAIRTSDGLGAGSSTRAPKISISGNAINGFSNAVRQEYLGNATLAISNNVISATTSASIFLEGSSTVPLKFPVINGNTITASGTNAILCNSFVVSTNIFGNTILDGNTTNEVGDLGAAILFVSNSHGSFITNNVIGNTAFGGGLFTYGVQNVAGVNSQIFKNTSAGNTFIGLSANTQFGRWWNAAPTNGIFDVNKGDFLQNVQLGAGGVAGWFCVETRNPTLSSDASSASTTVTVSTTSSISAGDIVLLCKDSNPYDGDYATGTQFHVDTVASVTNGTQFVLTTGIPAGDGTYTAGAASVRTARFKASAAIAA